tara:strand:- start:305 stop:1663 length:1359 start_codon:yes stop_codon:yes gene_type:complete
MSEFYPEAVYEQNNMSDQETNSTTYITPTSDVTISGSIDFETNKYFNQVQEIIKDFDNYKNKNNEDAPIRVKKITFDELDYFIANYNNNIFDTIQDKELHVYRSVVFDADGKVISFSPSKCMNSHIDTFLSEQTNDKFVMQHLVEGTMINLFSDNRKSGEDSWVISTKGTIGCKLNYFRNECNRKTFSEMFDDALKYMNLSYDMFDKNIVYSFVLHHPENRIVTQFSVPTITLVEAYSINDRMVRVVSLPTAGWVDMVNFDIPSQLDDCSKNMYGDTFNTPPNISGYVIKNTETNERIKFRNPSFEYVKHLRGNQSKLEYTYLQLRKNGRMHEYLTWFPEHSTEMNGFKEKVHIFTRELYSNYVDCYIKKMKPLKEYAFEFRNHMFDIHQKYKTEFQPMRRSIQYNDVIQHVNDLHESKLMFALNYKKRPPSPPSENIETTEFEMPCDLSVD